MSQSKGVGSKRKAAIPSEISVSIKTPKSRKFLFPKESISSTPRDSETEDATEQTKRSKMKKLRKTQNFIDFDDDILSEAQPTVFDGQRKKTASVESMNSESSEVFLESTEKQKSTTKSKKKKMRLPAVVIDDLQGLDDNESYCEEQVPHIKRKLRKHRSVESNSSSTMEATNTEDYETNTRGSKKSRNREEVELLTTKTRSSRKPQKQESFEEAIDLDNKPKGNLRSGKSLENKRNQITNSKLDNEMEESCENGEEGEVTITNKCFSSVDEDDEINTQGPERNTKRKKRSKKSKQKNDQPVEQLETRSTRKGRKTKETADDNEENKTRTSFPTDNTEEDVQIGPNFADTEDEDSRIRRKKTKKSQEKIVENKEVKTRNSKRQKDKKINDENTDNDCKVAKKDILSTTDEDVFSTKKQYNSTEEDEENYIQNSNKKRKRTKKSVKKQNEDETITTNTRRTKLQKKKAITSESLEDINFDSKPNNKIEDLGKNEINELKIENISTEKRHSAVDENNEIEAQLSTKTRKRSKKSDRKNDEDKTTNESSTARQQEIETKDENEENQVRKSTNELNDVEEIKIEETMSSGIEAQTSKNGRRSKKSINQEDDDTNTINKSRNSRQQKEHMIKVESEEIESNDTEVSNKENESQPSTKKRKRSKKSGNKHNEDETVINTRNPSLKKQQKIKNDNEDIENKEFDENVQHASSIDEKNEVKAENSAKKTRKQKKSNEKVDEETAVTYNRRSLKGIKDEIIKDNNEEKKQAEDSEENITSKNEDNKDNAIKISEDGRRSSRRSEKRISGKILKDQSFDENIRKDSDNTTSKKDSILLNSEISKTVRRSNTVFNYDSSGKSEENTDSEEVEFSSVNSSLVSDDVTTVAENKRRSSRRSEVILKNTRSSETVLNLETNNEKNENERNSSLINGDNSASSTRKRGRIFNFDSSGKSEENTEDSADLEEIELSSKNTSFSNVDDVNPSTGRKRKRSKQTDRTSHEERIKAPKISISKVNNDLDEGTSNGKTDISNTRSSRRTFSLGSTDEPEEAVQENDVQVFNDKSFSFIDKTEERPVDRSLVEPKAQGRKSSTGRKRWTIVTDKKELPMFENAETSNISLSVNTNQRRSVRKRWSTELKKKFESLKKENESIISNVEASEEYSFLKKDEQDILCVKSSPNSTLEYPVPTRKVDYLDSPMPFSTPPFEVTNDKLDETYTPEKSKISSSFRRSSKRLSRSLDLSEGISPLEETITLEKEPLKLNVDDQGSSSYRKSRTPGSILKRRGTYDVDVSVTDMSILRSLSDSNMSDPEVLFKQDAAENAKKNVRFQHVTVRKGCVRKDNPRTPDNRFESDHLLATNERKSGKKLTAANKSVSFDQTMFSTSSLASSTPLHSLRKNTIMKQTMRREKLSNIVDRRSRSVETKRDKFVSRIRMPNFTKIHQKAMDRVEDIAAMTRRKAERARLLLSGQKPTAATNSSNKSQEKINIQPKHPKQLKFNSQQFTNQETSSSNMNKITKATVPPKIDTLKSKVKDVKQPIGLTKIATNPLKKFEIASTKPVFPKSTIADKFKNVKTKPTQFEGAVKRAEEIKNIATKSKSKTNAREEVRNYVKGVRGNRRFELLMKMRADK